MLDRVCYLQSCHLWWKAHHFQRFQDKSLYFAVLWLKTSSLCFHISGLRQPKWFRIITQMWFITWRHCGKSNEVQSFPPDFSVCQHCPWSLPNRERRNKRHWRINMSPAECQPYISPYLPELSHAQLPHLSSPSLQTACSIRCALGCQHLVLASVH